MKPVLLGSQYIAVKCTTHTIILNINNDLNFKRRNLTSCTDIFKVHAHLFFSFNERHPKVLEFIST